MIDEHLEEQASLYVLGALDAEETRTFEAAMRRDPELQGLVTSLRTASDAMAGTAPSVKPPAELRQRILDQIENRAHEEKIVRLPASSPGNQSAVWLPWALAACLAIICGLLVLHQTRREDEFNTQFAGLNQTIATLQAATNDLHAVVADLTQKNELAKIRIAVLDSQVPDSKAVAVTLWDNEKQDGVLVVQKLPELGPDKDYQLWVIDPSVENPIDAGVFSVDAAGNQRAVFKTKSLVKAANKFAVTVERKGGVPKAQGQMVLLGG